MVAICSHEQHEILVNRFNCVFPKLKMRSGILYIDNQPFKPAVQAPGCTALVYPIDELHVARMKVHKGEDKYKGMCRFVGYSVEVKDVADVRTAYTKVAWLHPNALHVVCAYRLPGLDFVNLSRYEDNEEYGVGRTLYKVLEESEIFNRAIFIVRHYGNVHLGLVRFHMYSQAVKSAISKSEFNSILQVRQEIQ